MKKKKIDLRMYTNNYWMMTYNVFIFHMNQKSKMAPMAVQSFI